MMKHNRTLAAATGIAVALASIPAMAQNINVTRSVLEGLPYTLAYPEPMQASGGGDDPIIVNHPNAPLQCEMSLVPVEDTGWTAETALASLNEAEVAAAWAETLPGFAVTGKGLAAYQDTTALLYEGDSTGSPIDLPLTLVHTETVSNGRGYVLECLYATAEAERARPVVDFIIANFSTRADADCCVGLAVETDEPAP